MIAVACGMEDDDNKSNIDRSYNAYKDHQASKGMIAKSEFDYINDDVVGSRFRLRSSSFVFNKS